MLTLATAKTYLRITDTDATRDAFITALIPIIYQDIIGETNNPMIDNNSAINSPDIYFVAPDLIKLDAGGFVNTSHLSAGDYISVIGTRRNDGILSISTITDTKIECVEQVIVAETMVPLHPGMYSTLLELKVITVAMNIIPSPIDFIAARMIGYQLSNVTSAGIVGESIGNYSYTRARSDKDANYPADLLKALSPWKYHTVGRGGVHWHINENRTWVGGIGVSSYGD